jgi:hypothetical protein
MNMRRAWFFIKDRAYSAAPFILLGILLAAIACVALIDTHGRL